MASSIASFHQFPDEKARDYQKYSGEGKPGDGVLQMVVAQLDSGLEARGNFFGSSPGSACRTKGATFMSGAINGGKHRGDIPPIPDIAFDIIVGIKNPAGAVMVSYNAGQFNGAHFLGRLPASRRSSGTTPRSTRATMPSSLLNGVMICQPGFLQRRQVCAFRPRDQKRPAS